MKASSAVLASSQTATPPAAADIDRLRLLRARIEEHDLRIAADVAEEKALTAKLLQHYSEVPADRIEMAEGESTVLQLTMRQEEQDLVEGGKAKVFKFLGKDVYLALSDIPFGVLKTALGGKYESVVKKERTGRRSVKVAPKMEPRKAA